VENRVTIPASELQVGDQGYCTLDSIYVAPSGPDEGHDVGSTARFLLPDANIYTEPVTTAKVHVTRLENGLAIRVPTGEVPSRYLPQVVPGSVPVLAAE
jgi:hypothetical protein